MSHRMVSGRSPETALFLAAGAVAALWLSLAAASPHGQELLLILAVAVAIAGLPHGALDPWVAWQAGIWRKRGGFVAFHLAYLALAAAVVAFWHWAPGTSLAAFLLVSAWHFAGDWRHALPGWLRLLSGAALLTLPAWHWPEQVRGAFSLLAATGGTAIADVLTIVAPGSALVLALAALMAWPRSPAAAIELITLIVLAVLLPPLLYFAVYFCALHSVRHLRTAAVAAGPMIRVRMTAVALLYSALTLLIALLAWPWISQLGAQASGWQDGLLRMVFIGLAALTLPHMLVVMQAERTLGHSR